MGLDISENELAELDAEFKRIKIAADCLEKMSLAPKPDWALFEEILRLLEQRPIQN